jgi:hypothetical protein
MTPESYGKSRINWQYLYSRRLELPRLVDACRLAEASHSTKRSHVKFLLAGSAT